LPEQKNRPSAKDITSFIDQHTTPIPNRSDGSADHILASIERFCRYRQQFFDTTMKPFGRSTGCATRTIMTPSSRLHITVVLAAL
jgi:hypothetical protein